MSYAPKGARSRCAMAFLTCSTLVIYDIYEWRADLAMR